MHWKEVTHGIDDRATRHFTRKLPKLATSVLTHIFILMLLSIATLLESAQAESIPKKISMLLQQEQVFYRNNMMFTKDRSAEGASAFLFDRGGEQFVGTAGHLLGSAMDIEPAIRAVELQSQRIKWSLHSQIDGKLVAETTFPVYPSDHPDHDILIFGVKLNAQAPSGSYKFLPLSEQDLEEGKTYYLIGCPYSESDCKQNAYPVKALEIYRYWASMELTPPTLQTSGFSGAPILNEDGELVAVYAGRGGDGTRYVTSVVSFFSMADSLLKFQNSCYLGNAGDCYFTGIQFDDAEGAQKDGYRAATFFELACNLDDPQACEKLALMHVRGNVIEKDLHKALKLREKSCKGDYKDACHNLGNQYFTGKGVTKDLNKGIALYEKACNLGHGPTCTHVSSIFSDQGSVFGKESSIEVDLTKFTVFAQKACKLSEATGCHNLALSYEYGYIGSIDADKAVEFYHKSCGLGYAEACYNIGLIFDIGELQAQDVSLAMTYYEYACNGGDYKGCYKLGDIYDKGKGAKKDAQLSQFWFTKGCDGAESSSCERLKGKDSNP